MAAAIYSLCALVALACTILLARAYRTSRYRLLFWGALCFAGFTLNNVLLFIDKIVFVMVDLSLPRLAVALAAMMVLIYGLIWDTQ
jgi:hypothetical protein